MAQEQGTPSYEELLKPGHGSPGLWRDLVAELASGEVREVEVGDRREQAVRNSISAAARTLGIKIGTRKKDGVLYVIRLRDEDIPDA